MLLHYAGWTDKLHAVLGGVNPVAAPFLSFSLPEPTGVVGIVAPDAPPLLGLIAELAPALAAGNTAVAILSETDPLPGLDLAEALGVSDLPAGVVNLLSGRRGELAKALGAHRDLNAIVDAAGDAELSAELDRLAAETIKRVRHGIAATTYDTPRAMRSTASRRSPSSRPPGTRSAPRRDRSRQNSCPAHDRTRIPSYACRGAWASAHGLVSPRPPSALAEHALEPQDPPQDRQRGGVRRVHPVVAEAPRPACVPACTGCQTRSG